MAVCLSTLCTDRNLLPRNINFLLLVLIFVRGWLNHGVCAAGSKLKKKIIHLIGSPIRDLQARFLSCKYYAASSDFYIFNLEVFGRQLHFSWSNIISALSMSFPNKVTKVLNQDWSPTWFGTWDTMKTEVYTHFPLFAPQYCWRSHFDPRKRQRPSIRLYGVTYWENNNPNMLS
jgi:hypothetical protein